MYSSTLETINVVASLKASPVPSRVATDYSASICKSLLSFSPDLQCHSSNLCILLPTYLLSFSSTPMSKISKMCRPLNYSTPHLLTLLSAKSQKNTFWPLPSIQCHWLELQTASMASPPPLIFTPSLLLSLRLLFIILSPPVPTCHYTLITLLLFATPSVALYC